MKTLENFKLTDLEKIVVNKYFGFNYNDLESNLDDNANWVDFYSVEEIESKILRGVFSSLVQKELIFFAECDEGTYYISDLGVILWFYLNDKKEFESCPKERIKQVLENY